jgi:curved DNA-binding protein CbpA
MVDYYDLLRVTKTATSDEIRRAYRQLAILLHPDKNPHPEAAAGFRAITEAYHVLIDPAQKKTYDAQLELDRLIERKGPAYRDPAYRRASENNNLPKRPVINSEKEFIRRLVPATKWVNRICIVLCLLLVTDMLLPSNYFQEVVMLDEGLMQQSMRSVSQHKLVTQGGHHFSVNYPDNLQFREEPEIVAETSGLFNLLKSIRTKSGQFRVTALASLYGNFIFAPILLLLLAFAGMVVRESDELKFNIALVSLLLVLLNMVFFVLSVW